MSSSDNVISLTQTRQQQITRHVLLQKLQPELHKVTNSFLQELMQGLFDTADDALFKMAENTAQNIDKNIYFDSMRIVRLQRKQIVSRFFSELDKAFERDPVQQQIEDRAFHELDIDKLELVSESDLEIKLAMENLINKIKSLYSSEINGADKRFLWLTGVDEINEDNKQKIQTPFSPDVIVKAFASGVEDLELTLEIQLIILKLFDVQCIHRLEGLYHALNELFIAHDVLAKIKHKAIKQPDYPASQHSAAQQNPMQRHLTGYPATTGVSQPANPLWDELQQLLGGQRHTGMFGVDPDIQVQRGTGQATTGTTALSTEDLLLSLNELQLNAIDELPQGGAHAVGNYLRVQLQLDDSNENTQKAINPVDNDLIDIVCLIFEYILEDPHLPSAAKASIGRLQIPMLKVAMLDKNFFSMNGHPARTLLNRLASSAVGIDESENLDNPYLAKIHEIVEQVLSEFTNDLEIFDLLIEELDSFIEQQEVVELELQEDKLKPQQQREEMALAQSWVRETLSQHLLGREIPGPVLDIVLGPWKEVMLQTYLQDGEHSELWQTQIRFIEVLCWSVEPKQQKLDKMKLGSIIQQLIVTLRQGMESIQSQPEEVEAILNTLEPYHLASMYGRNLADCVMQPEQLATEELSAVTDELQKVVMEDIVLEGWEQDDELEQINDEYLELARHLEMGKWVEFSDKNGKARRARLAWKSELLGEYTFLNWKFDVVADKSLLELADALRQGQARLVDDVPLMDRALSAVVNSLIPKSG